MKFENIKVGDIVFIKVGVRMNGYNNYKMFYVPKKVTKTTKTQFTIEGGNRYKKDRGGQIGERYVYAYKEDERVGYGKGLLVSDQTEELKAFKAKVAIEKSINSELFNFKMSLGTKISNENLNKFLDDVRAFKKLINEE